MQFIRDAAKRDKVRLWLPFIFLFCCSANLINWAVLVHKWNMAPDFTVFWAAAKMSLINPAIVYDSASLTVVQMWIVEPTYGLRPWVYPPTALIPLLPFSFLTFGAAFATFTAITGLLFVLISKKLWGDNWPLGLAFLIMSDAFLFAAVNGQMTFLVGALIIGGIICLSDRPTLAGCLLGVAATIKPQLLVLAPFALISCRQYKALVGAALSGLAMVIVTLPLGISLWSDWLASIPKFLAIVERIGILDRNVTPSGMLWSFGVTGVALKLFGILFVAIASVNAWIVFRDDTDWANRLVALVGGGIWCSPYTMNYDLALLAPAAIAFLLRGAKNNAPLLLMAISGFFLSSYGSWSPPMALAFMVIASTTAISRVARAPTNTDREKADANIRHLERV